MAGGIYLIQNEGEIVRLSEKSYDSEALLQELLARYPDLLAGDQMDPESPRRWMLVRREAGVPDDQGAADRWAVDHLFLDQDAVPTFVEVKRSSDTRLRREVVGQMLDYAANAVAYWPVEQLRASFESGVSDPRGTLTELLGEEAEGDGFWQRVKLNLQAGRIRMVFVSDEIPPELRRVVEFLNDQMDPAEVIAVQVRQFVGEGLRTLVPTVVGQSAQAQRKKSTGTTRQWDEPSFLAALRESHGPTVVAAARRVLEWATARGLEIWWGKGATHGSFFPWLRAGGFDHWTISVWTSGVVEVQFQHMLKAPPFSDAAKREDLRSRLTAIAGVVIARDRLEKRPTFPLSALEAPGAMGKFLEIMDWYIGELCAASGSAGEPETTAAPPRAP